MKSRKDHIRKTFLTGVFAAIPIVVTVIIVVWINENTEWITRRLFGQSIPFLGIVISLGSIYLIGMIANSLMGRVLLRWIDHLLARVPGIRQLYVGWKQIALTPGGTEGTFSRVVLIPDETGLMKWLGFTSGRLIEAGEPMYCVFVPSAPNPITGRLYFVPVTRCTLLDMTPEEAFKLILSTGNYVPALSAMETSADATTA
jgi:uncharacterized membrane protein